MGGGKGMMKYVTSLYMRMSPFFFIVDQPHLKKCSRKLFDSILC